MKVSLRVVSLCRSEHSSLELLSVALLSLVRARLVDRCLVRRPRVEFEVRSLVLHVLSAPSHRLLLVRLMLSWERHVVHDFEVVRSVMAYQNQQPVLAS